MKWYETSYRRSLCDMHIEDWDPQFLSDFSPVQYYENLRTARIQSPMLYFQSHVGHCYWPTQTGHIHAAFAEHPDRMRRLVELCHAGGMDVIGYYSLIFNTYEHDRHPEWRLIGRDGKSERERDPACRYGHCCSNNPDYRRFVYAQIAEMAAYFPVEGMFYDMPFFPQLCYCDSCRARWAAEVGGAMPEREDWSDPRWRRFILKAGEWMSEFCRSVAEETRKYLPDVSVEFNFACAAITSNWWNGTVEGVGDACDFANGDLYGGIYEQSFACKLYDAIGRHRPFEYMTSRCNPNLQKHTITKSDDQLALAVLLTTAHHGATLLIDAIDPIGTQDRRVYERMGRVFGQSIPYEPYMSGEQIADIGVFVSLTSKQNFQGQGFTNASCAVAAVKTLVERHIPVTVATRAQLDALAQYPVLVVPNLNQAEPALLDRLIAYVENGGCLYFSGADEPRLLSALLGGTYEGHTHPTRTYLAPKPGLEALFDDSSAAYPLPFDDRLPMVSGISDEDVLATITLPYTARDEARYASIHSDPPGVPTKYPAVAARRLGKGRVIWSAAPLELEPIENYRRIFCNLLGKLLPPARVETDAPAQVELVLHSVEDSLTVGAVQLTDIDTIPSLAPFTVRVRTQKPPRAVRRLPEGETLPFTYRDGYTQFTIDRLRIFQLYQLEAIQ